MTASSAQQISLRPYRLDDADRLAVLLNDPNVTAMTSSIPYPYARADAEAFLSGVRNEEGREVSRAVIAAGDLVGGIGLGVRANGGEELGYWIGKPHWGQGIASEAVRLFLVELSALGIDGPIDAQTMASNEASQRVLIKNGFTYVGDGRCVTPARESDTMAAKCFVLER